MLEGSAGTSSKLVSDSENCSPSRLFSHPPISGPEASCESRAGRSETSSPAAGLFCGSKEALMAAGSSGPGKLRLMLQEGKAFSDVPAQGSGANA